MAPVLREADTRISNENTDAIADRVSIMKPNTSPLRDTAYGNDNTPPPIIVDIELKIPTFADCWRSMVSNADGAIHSGDFDADDCIRFNFLNDMILIAITPEI